MGAVQHAYLVFVMTMTDERKEHSGQVWEEARSRRGRHRRHWDKAMVLS